MPTTPVPARRERGNASIEHLGYWIVAVILLAALIAGGTAMRAQIGGYVDQAFCTMRTLSPGCDSGSSTAATGGADAEGSWVKAGDPAAIDFTPDECLVGNSSDRREGGAKIAFFTAEGGRTVEVVEMRGADGKPFYLVKVNWDLEGGLTTGTGAGAASGKKDLGSGVELGARLDLSGTIGYGEGTTFKLTGSEDEAMALAGELMDHGADGADGLDPYAESTSITGKGSAQGKGGLTGGYGRETENGSPREGTVTAVEASLRGEVSHGWEATYNHQKQTTTYVTSYAGSITGEFNTEMGGTQGSRGWGSTVAITRDANNQIIKVEVAQIDEYQAGGAFTADHSESNPVSKNGGGANLDVDVDGTDKVITTYELAVNDSNRAVVEEWLSEQASVGDDYLPTTPFETAGWDPSVGSDVAIQQLLHDQGVGQQVIIRDGRTREELGFEIKFGLTFGGHVAATQTNGEVLSNKSLTAPDGSASRTWEDNPDCPV